MQVLIQPLLQYLILPLAIKFAKWGHTKYSMDRVDDSYAEREKERDAIVKAVTNAETNEDRRLLSIALARHDSMSINND